MSKRCRLINRKSYFNNKLNVEMLNDYYRDYNKGKLNDMEIFEVSLMYLLVDYKYVMIDDKTVSKNLRSMDIDVVREWFLEDLTSLERSRLASATYRAFKSHVLNPTDDSDLELEVLEDLIKVVMGEDD